MKQQLFPEPFAIISLREYNSLLESSKASTEPFNEMDYTNLLKIIFNYKEQIGEFNRGVGYAPDPVDIFIKKLSEEYVIYKK